MKANLTDAAREAVDAVLPSRRSICLSVASSIIAMPFTAGAAEVPGDLGICYEQAMRFVLLDNPGDRILVHGQLEYHPPGKLHAWCEVGDMAFDFSFAGKAVFGHRAIYYKKIGAVSLVRYDRETALRRLLDTLSFGPWSDPLTAIETYANGSLFVWGP